jgi:hypothetical protein
MLYTTILILIFNLFYLDEHKPDTKQQNLKKLSSYTAPNEIDSLVVVKLYSIK